MFSNVFSNLQSYFNAYPEVKDTIPQSERGYSTNNKYHNVPPIMHDGRAITAAWQPHSTENAKLIEDNKIQSNWEYRRYLTKNANDIMKTNFLASSNDTGYNTRPIDVPSIQDNKITEKMNTPKLFSSVADNKKVRGTPNSDLKNLYMSREQLQALKVSPVITQDILIRHNEPKPEQRKQ